MAELIKLTINGTEVEAEKGATLIDVPLVALYAVAIAALHARRGPTSS